MRSWDGQTHDLDSYLTREEPDEEPVGPTPGPWIIDSGDSPIWGVFAEDGNAVCYLAEPSAALEPLRPGADMANARLIAAAPLFLAACVGSDPDVPALDWLSALLTELTSDCSPLRLQQSDDPQALHHAIEASSRLLRELRAAVERAEGGPQ